MCGTRVSLDEPLVWTCPHSSPSERHHVLGFQSTGGPDHHLDDSHLENPFLAYRERLAVDAFGEAIGLEKSTRISIIENLDTAIGQVAGVGFRRTPLLRADELSDVLQFSPNGGIWVKDETHNVAGSHKARHLFTELVYLLMAEHAGLVPWISPEQRPPLAIASCGNAAIAASTLARAVDWPIAVHVPVGAQDAVLSTLSSLHADVRTCPRIASDPAGDPCVLRFREIVRDGAIPFGVQGTENVWCLDGGRTLGWEIVDQAPLLNRVFIQVGGGAFAATLAQSYLPSSPSTQMHVVQTEGCAPLVRAWKRWSDDGFPNTVAQHWSRYMWPWESEPKSFADGILDDETFDWIDIFQGLKKSNGSAVVSSENNVVHAHTLAHRHTNIDVSPTGSAGLAGVLEIRDQISDDEKVLVVFSGCTRT